MQSEASAREQGFSLIELLVVMVITFFISGAIYGLLASGQNAFQKEPEVADRQQNIRVAMDVIAKDVANAGAGLPAFVQVFTATDPVGTALNGMGPAGAMGAPAQALRNGDGSTNSDVLEMIEADERCPALTVCTTPLPAAGAASFNSFITVEGAPTCFADQTFAILTDNLNMRTQLINGNPVNGYVAGFDCPPVGGPEFNGGLNLRPDVVIGTNANRPLINTPAFLHAGRVVRYMIAPDTVDAEPVLWRSATGLFEPTTGAATTAPGTTPSAWQAVARGIEDMQVEYMSAAGNWTNAPPLAVACALPPGTCATPGSYDAIVRQVRVTLSARAAGQPSGTVQQGATTAGAGTGVARDAIRGQMTSVTQPRAALVALELGDRIR